MLETDGIDKGQRGGNHALLLAAVADAPRPLKRARPLLPSPTTVAKGPTPTGKDPAPQVTKAADVANKQWNNGSA